MAPVVSKQISRWSPARVGIVIGGAVGIMLFVLFALSGHWIFVAATMSLGLLSPVALVILLVGIGIAVGKGLAKANRVPSLRPIQTLALAICVLLGPLLVGLVETAVFRSPFPLPEDRLNVRWKYWPGGGSSVTFESAKSVPELHQQLVQSAEQEGWVCSDCKYQKESNRGFGELSKQETVSSNPKGRVLFAVHNEAQPLSENEQAPSDITQAFVGYDRKTWSVELAFLAVLVLLLAGCIQYSKRRSPI